MIEAEPTTPSDDDDGLESYYATRIGAAWSKAVESIVETGRILIEAKSKLHGRFLAMVKDRLGMSPDTAQRLMAIAADDWLANADPGRLLLLPPSWTVLYLITTIDVADRERLISSRCIRPDARRSDIQEAIRQIELERNPRNNALIEQPPKSSRAPRSIFDRADAPVEDTTPPDSSEPELAPDEAHAVLLELARLVAGHAYRSGNGKAYGFCVRGDEARAFERLLAQARAIILAADSVPPGDT